MIKLVTAMAVNRGWGHESVVNYLVTKFPGMPNFLRTGISFVAKCIVPSAGGPAAALDNEITIIENGANQQAVVEVSRYTRSLWSLRSVEWTITVGFTYQITKAALAVRLGYRYGAWLATGEEFEDSFCSPRRLVYTLALGWAGSRLLFKTVEAVTWLVCRENKVDNNFGTVEKIRVNTEPVPQAVNKTYTMAGKELTSVLYTTETERALMNSVLQPVKKVVLADADQFASKSINKLPTALNAARERTRPVELYLYRMYTCDKYHPQFRAFDLTEYMVSLTANCTYLLVDREALSELLDPSISGPYYTRTQVHDNMSRAISGRLDRIDVSRFNSMLGFRYDHDTVVAAMFIYDHSVLSQAIPIKPGKEEISPQ